MDEKGASDFGLHPSALGRKGAFLICNLADVAKRDRMREDQHAVRMGMRTSGPTSIRSHRFGKMPKALVAAWIFNSHHPSQKMCLQPISVCGKRTSWLPYNAPSLTLVMNHKFTWLGGSDVWIGQTFNVTMGKVLQRGLPRFRGHVDARNFFVESQNGQLRLRHDKRQNVLRTCQVRMSFCQPLGRSQSMVSICQIQRVASLPSSGEFATRFRMR